MVLPIDVLTNLWYFYFTKKMLFFNKKNGIYMKPKAEIKVTQIQKETIPEKIIKQFKEMINSGQLKPGTRIPAERALAKMFNVGRPALREALKALSLLGILENRHRKGTFLTENSSQWKIDPLSIMLSVKKGTLIEIFEARASLEVTVAGFAAERRTDEDIVTLKSISEKMRNVEAPPDEYVKLDLKFHEALAVAAKNQVILDLLQKLNRLYFDARGFLFQYPEESGMKLSAMSEAHDKILQCVIERDKDKAARTMKYYLDIGRKEISNFLLWT